MTTPNPAHSAVVKITDPHGDVQYLHYLHGWCCTFSWVHLCSGIDEKQIKALKFALDQCHHPNLVLAAVKRYGSPKFTYELDVEQPTEQPTELRADDFSTPPSGMVRAVDPTGSFAVWIKPPEAELRFRLTVLAQEARAAGWALAWWSPDELEGINVEALLDVVVQRGEAFIAEHQPDDEEE
jgi:hypothetical protein